MDRLYSYNWLKEHTGLKITAEEFAKKFSLHSMTIDRIHRQTPKFSGVITARITEIAVHPNADKLRLATVETGTGSQTVVCGAPNIAVGQVVALAQAGAMVINSKEPGAPAFAITKATIRGVESNGMLCSLKELGLGEDHHGIWVLPAETLIGKPLEKLLDFPDVQLQIEITSNRPDAMSVLGLAREARAVFGGLSSSRKRGPLGRLTDASRDSRLRGNDLRGRRGKAKLLSVKVLDKKFCPRYQAIVIDNITVKPSPLWLQMRLLRSGLRPINNIVDITNYILLEYGQPMHAFDYMKLEGKSISVRKAKSRERILALDGKTYELTAADSVIADGIRPIAIAGVMGGQDTAVDETTTTIVFECATFDSVSVRKTSRSLNLRSDSSELFEKGLSPSAVSDAMTHAIALTQQLAGGASASKLFDVRQSPARPVRIALSLETIQRYFGFALPIARVKSILTALGCDVKDLKAKKQLQVTIPWWRSDILAEHDLIEELARVYGYDQIPKRLPSGALVARAVDPILRQESLLKRVLQGMGLTEIVTYSAISSKVIESIGARPADCIRLANPLSTDQEYLRPSLLPAMLEAVAANQVHGLPLWLFELSNVYLATGAKTLPHERPVVLAALVDGTPEVYFRAKGLALQVAEQFGLRSLTLRPAENDSAWDSATTLELVVDGRNIVGRFGLASPLVRQRFGIDSPVAVVELQLAELIPLMQPAVEYQPIPSFPVVTRDLTIVIDQALQWSELKSTIEHANALLVNIEYVGTFTGKGIDDGKKSLTLRLTFRSNERTLKSEEVDVAITAIVEKLQQHFRAAIR